MIILDTNIVSELLRKKPNEQVIHWLLQQQRLSLFTTTISYSEMLYGIHIMPKGQKQQQLLTGIKNIFDTDFRDLILSFDQQAAEHYADIAALRKTKGLPISQFDAMIAAITRSKNAILATRNIKDFQYCGIELINPWNI
ncbi:type II toxin-antitoxin system VapC family toxin [Acinetobacter corruptisaponis]|uniref:Type II toxin-antitoxin system VapC family toxin n=1 Tax=Acinetobacter corruptisaponis TaxID=3045147 RepID=A0ABY8S785_9GAMM|nr:type II toxin-antitoxin system VapC family toxin [Acinetobacter sp. KCTC 92772]WHP07560.1 type II toxin-antitoxin system VapC family toxin [Acinetobacter sp. KCTC 92772]